MVEIVPGVAILAVVLPDRPPLPFAEVGAPFLPGDTRLACIVQPFLFGDIRYSCAHLPTSSCRHRSDLRATQNSSQAGGVRRAGGLTDSLDKSRLLSGKRRVGHNGL